MSASFRGRSPVQSSNSIRIQEVRTSRPGEVLDEGVRVFISDGGGGGGALIGETVAKSTSPQRV